MTKLNGLFVGLAAMGLSVCTTPAAGQNYTPDGRPFDTNRDRFGVPMNLSTPSQARPDFYAVCNQRDIYSRWGSQVDSHIAGQLNRNDWAGAFSAYGNPYARNQSQQQAQCMAVQQYYQLADRFGGIDNVPRDIMNAADRNLYIAFVAAPQADAERRSNYTNRRLQERAADSLLRGLGIGRH